jgi:hypothetical protein
MATSPNGAELKWWDCLKSFYHNLSPVNKKFRVRWAAILTTARVLITVSMALWMRGIADSSIPKLTFSVRNGELIRS